MGYYYLESVSEHFRNYLIDISTLWYNSIFINIGWILWEWEWQNLIDGVYVELYQKNLRKTWVTLSYFTSQACFKKWPLKPSPPGSLVSSISLSSCKTSTTLKCWINANCWVLERASLFLNILGWVDSKYVALFPSSFW